MKSTVPAILALLLLAACGKSEPDKSATKDSSAATDSSGGASSGPALPEGELTYYFGTNPARTAVSCTTETKVLNILARTNIASGSATVNYAEGKGSCHIVVPVAGLDTGDVGQTNAMKGETYLDGKQFPTIEFKSEKTTKKSSRTWEIAGKFTLHGVTKDLTIEADVVPIPEKSSKSWGEGKWVRVTTEFTADMEEYGMKLAEQYVGTVDPVWKVSVSIFGTTSKPTGPVAVVKDKEPTLAELRAMRPGKESREGLAGTLYRVGRPMQLSSIQVTSVTEAEVVPASTRSIGGYMGIDHEKGTGEVRLNFSVKSLKTGIDKRDKTLQGQAWLDAENNPYIRFMSTEATRKSEGTWHVKGELSMHGVTKPIETVVKMKKHSVERAKKLKWGSKPVVEFEAEFSVKFSDFGVTIPEKSKLNVSDELKIQMRIGATEM